MIDSILLVDDESLFHIVFEDACSYLDISLSLEAMYSADDAEDKFKEWSDSPDGKPDVAFIDLNIMGSTINGIDLIQRINNVYGNGVVIGIISSSEDATEIEKAKAVGAQFWIVKSDDIEPRLEQFKEDYDGYKNKTQSFKVYR